MGIFKPESIEKIEQQQKENKGIVKRESNALEFSRRAGLVVGGIGALFVATLIGDKVAKILFEALKEALQGENPSPSPAAPTPSAPPAPETPANSGPAPAESADQDLKRLEVLKSRVMRSLGLFKDVNEQTRNLYKLAAERGDFYLFKPDNENSVASVLQEQRVEFGDAVTFQMHEESDYLDAPIAYSPPARTIVMTDEISSDEWLAVFLYYNLSRLQSEWAYFAKYRRPPSDKISDESHMRATDIQTAIFKTWWSKDGVYEKRKMAMASFVEEHGAENLPEFVKDELPVPGMTERAYWAAGEAFLNSSLVDEVRRINENPAELFMPESDEPPSE